MHYGICEMGLLHPIWNWRHVNVLSDPSHNSVHSRTPLWWRGHKKFTVMNNQLKFFSLHVNRLSQSWDKAISYFDLENPRPRSRVWFKGKVIQSAQYEIDLLPFCFTSIRPTIPEIHLQWNLSGKARNVSLKLRNLVNFHAQIMFILPLMSDHLFWKAIILGGLFRGVPLYFKI